MGKTLTLRFIGFAMLSGLVGCGRMQEIRARFGQKNPPPVSANPPTSLPPIIAKLRNTHYYTIFETDYADEETVPVHGIRGELLATVSPSFYRDLSLEGTGKLRNGRVLNFVSANDGDYQFAISPFAWGNGVGRCPLKPFRTIAIDPRVIPLGSSVHIDETKGMRLPDGTIHDGTWYAEDIGGAIQRDRVDLYVGKRGWNSTLTNHRISHLQALTVRILKLPTRESCAD